MQAPGSADRTYEILKKVRKIEIKTRGLSNQMFSGGYHSAFKGRGMSFSEVRNYQFGDDVRNIDWNVTARLDEPYVKVFEEERELTVMLLADVSPSTLFGTQPGAGGEALLKQEYMAEICAVLAFSAMNNQDKVGALLFTDQTERFIPPRKGKNHLLRIVRELIEATPEGRSTHLGDALLHLNNVLKKSSIVFIVSDFMTDHAAYKDALTVARRRHDVVGIHVWDDREAALPSVGLVHVRDAETGETGWIDTSSAHVRATYAAAYAQNLARARETFLRAGADFVSLNLRESYTQALMNLFSQRMHRR
ncbi:MAG: DUF58 domain-containing protein [Bacteroidia bacterium]|nr:DUF58 domain-containing protein [Bacteroidia bacterium]